MSWQRKLCFFTLFFRKIPVSTLELLKGFLSLTDHGETLRDKQRPQTQDPKWRKDSQETGPRKTSVTHDDETYWQNNEALSKSHTYLENVELTMLQSGLNICIRFFVL